MLHTRTTDRVPLVCDWCFQSFSKREHLLRHVRSHTREKPFACTTCGKHFSRNDTLLRHSRGHDVPVNTQARARTQAETINIPPVASTSQPSSNSNPDTEETVDIGTGNLQHHAAGNDFHSALPNIEHMLFSGEAQQQHQQHQQHQQQQQQQEQQQLLHPTPATSTQPNGIKLPYPSLFPQSNSRWPAIDPNNANAVSSYLILNGTTEGSRRNEDPHNISFETQTPAWLTSADFDLSAFHSSIINASPGWPMDDLGRPYLEQIDYPPRPLENTASHKEDSVHKHWVTTLLSHDSDKVNTMTDVADERNNIDETYRENLSQRLLPRVPYEPLPSTDFLNLCTQMYFTRFNPIFPLIHASTFRPSSQSSLLLLSICSVGSLFLGSPRARNHGQSIFERLNKAIMASWETVLVSGKSEGLAMTQAGVIGQTFGMLSGRPKDLLVVQALHGTVITWARRCGIFESSGFHKVTNTPELNADNAWKRWAKREERSRVATALYIHDAEYSALFNTAPLLRHSVSKLPSLCSNDLWEAPSAGEWKTVASQTPTTSNLSATRMPSPVGLDKPEPHQFRAYCELEGIAASISEARDLGTLPEASHDQVMALLQFQDRNAHPEIATDSDPFCLGILWHLTFISLLADMNRLELCVGRDGYEQSQRHLDYARSWAQSQDARRCVIHGVLILQKAETMAIGASPEIHVPRALFAAALVWYCYTEFGRDSLEDGPIRKTEAPELKKLSICSQNLLFEAHGFKHSRPTSLESRIICRLHDLLIRVGHWEISRKFASIIMCMVYGDTEG